MFGEIDHFTHLWYNFTCLVRDTILVNDRCGWLTPSKAVFFCVRTVMATPKPRPMTYEVRESGCWEVTSHKPNGFGYPKVHWNYKSVYTHRLVWEQKYGEIPEGMQVLHRCDNPLCVNPDHLFLGTAVDNMKDRHAKRHYAKGEAHPMAKLTEDEVREIQRLDAKGVTQVEIAARFGTTQGHVSNICRQRVWR